MPTDNYTWAIIKAVAVDMQELKGGRKDFEATHLITFGGNPPPPHSKDRKKPQQLSVADAELAYSTIVDRE